MGLFILSDQFEAQRDGTVSLDSDPAVMENLEKSFIIELLTSFCHCCRL